MNSFRHLFREFFSLHFSVEKTKSEKVGDSSAGPIFNQRVCVRAGRKCTRTSAIMFLAMIGDYNRLLIDSKIVNRTANAINVMKRLFLIFTKHFSSTEKSRILL